MVILSGKFQIFTTYNPEQVLSMPAYKPSVVFIAGHSNVLRMF